MEREKIPESVKKRRTFKLIVGVVVPILVAVGLSGFFFWQWQRTRRLPDLSDALAEPAMPAVEGVADEAASQGAEALPSTSSLQIGGQAGQAPAAGPELRAYSFAVRNGAGISGLAARFGRDIVASVEGATIVETSNAEATTYDESILVSFVEDKLEVERIAEILGISLGELPAGEPEPEADFLVIVGRDQAEGR